eukprot:9742554-Karenia_brevis.AAC.1
MERHDLELHVAEDALLILDKILDDLLTSEERRLPWVRALMTTRTESISFSPTCPCPTVAPEVSHRERKEFSVEMYVGTATDGTLLS